MAWSIAEVARMAKVSSRTLRYYDQIGLLPPAWVGPNGYRYYERDQLLQLQEILLLRQLGLDLETIAKILNDEQDRVAALQRHHQALLAERDRFQRLADTVARTIEELKGGEVAMAAKPNLAHWFEGLDSKTQAAYEAEAARRWGAAKVQASKEKVKHLDKDQVMAQWGEILERLVELIEAGAEPNEDRVLDVVDSHYQWLNHFWTPNRESYTGLGNLYADDPRFREKFDRTDPRLAEFLRRAMAAYAEARLA
mgnify:CR=1 FL=1